MVRGQAQPGNLISKSAILYKDGDIFHSESIPILRSICRKHRPEYLGRNLVEQSRADALGQSLWDPFFKWASPYMFAEDYKDKMEEGKAAAADYLNQLAAVLGDNDFIAGGVTYADF